MKTAEPRQELTQGAILALAVIQAAAVKGQSVNEFASPLSPWPGKWLEQLRQAKQPKPATVARIEALLAGREVPPPPPNSFQAAPRKASILPIRRQPDPIPTVDPVDRDPCFRCGVRGDIGCAHRRPCAA